MKLISSFAPISGIPVRDLLKQMRFVPDTPDDEDVHIALAMINGTKPRITNNHHIKFLSKTNVKRPLTKLASACANWLKKQSHTSQIEVHLSEEDYLSNIFFAELKRFGITICPTSFSYGNYSDLLNPIEITSVEMIASQKINLVFLINYVRARVDVGDYHTAYSMISKIPEADRTEACQHILNLCSDFFIHANKP